MRLLRGLGVAAAAAALSSRQLLWAILQSKMVETFVALVRVGLVDDVVFIYP